MVFKSFSFTLCCRKLDIPLHFQTQRGIFLGSAKHASQGSWLHIQVIVNEKSTPKPNCCTVWPHESARKVPRRLLLCCAIQQTEKGLWYTVAFKTRETIVSLYGIVLLLEKSTCHQPTYSNPISSQDLFACGFSCETNICLICFGQCDMLINISFTSFTWCIDFCFTFDCRPSFFLWYHRCLSRVCARCV